MKKIKILLLSVSFLITFNLFAASLDVRFSDMKIVGSNLVFDMEIRSNVGTTYLGGFEAYINYNTAAFGTNISGATTVTGIGLAGVPGYSISKNNNNSSRLYVNAVNLFPNFFPASIVLTTYSKVLRISIPITNASQNAGISLQCSLMQAGQYWYPAPSGGTSTTYSPINCMNDLITLPLTPNLALMFSEIGDPSNTTTNFVEIYNAGTTSVDFTNHYAWYLNNFSGSSSVQLAGTLAAGAKYVIAVDNTDFVPNMTSVIVGTGGTTKYLLSTYGDYLAGTVIDVYDGSATGFNFTGKHAVRLYSVVSPNTTLTASEWAIYPAQNIDMTPGSHHSTITWDGVPDSEWRSKNNWAQGFIPDAGHNVSVPNVGATPVITKNDNATTFDLTIAGPGIRLIIDSDQANGDGSLITYGTVTGTASVKRFLKADRFWYVTQPITSATANVFLHTWLWTYNEAISNWDPFIEDETAPLNLMKGYAVWTSSINPWHQGWSPVGDTTTSYDGTLNTGAISTNLTKGGDGWNFTGNPYVSAVDWEASGWIKTNLLTNSYAVWDGSVLPNGTYATYSAGGGSTNGGTRYIPAAQGFYVQASAPGTLGVTNAVRTHSTQNFWKDEETMQNRLSLTISNGNISDETVIYFNEAATSELDYSYDARKMMAVASPQAYTMLGNDNMAINTFNNPAETPKVTLGVNAPEAGEYTLTASNIESFDASTPIYLEDILTGQKINLREMAAYTFSSEEGTSERFAVHFAEYQGIGDNTAAEVNSIYSSDRNIYVDFNATRGEIAIYNILGQEICHAVASNGLNKISVPNGNTVYIVKVISDNNTVTKKVFVK